MDTTQLGFVWAGTKLHYGGRRSESKQDSGDRGGEIACQQSGDHRAQPQLREIVSPCRHQRTDAANLDRDTGKVSEAAERISCQRVAALIEGGREFGEAEVANEFIEH